MRRAPVVLTSTILGTAAVLTFQPRQPQLTALAATSTTDETSAASGTTPVSGTSAGTTPASGTSAGTTAASGTRTATGAAVDTVYGAAQVRVTVKDGTITNVEAVQLQSADPKSVQISNGAAPLLAQSALDQQSGDIDAVSGATYTSGSYEASLQSALDKLGFTAADGSKGNTDTTQLQQGGEHGGPGGGSAASADGWQ
jgi:uncharacterized protein with FMN-binding domain